LNYIQLECVAEIYAMRYDAIYLYADVNHVGYKKITLPPDAPANPANKDKVIAPVQKKRRKTQCGGWTMMMMMKMTTMTMATL
jgi:hypothetical protein